MDTTLEEYVHAARVAFTLGLFGFTLLSLYYMAVVLRTGKKPRK